MLQTLKTLSAIITSLIDMVVDDIQLLINVASSLIVMHPSPPFSMSALLQLKLPSQLSSTLSQTSGFGIHELLLIKGMSTL